MYFSFPGLSEGFGLTGKPWQNYRINLKEKKSI
jgi:hypothetical protein